MNKQLIEKVIKSSDSNACPEFAYENPLLDRNIAGALARSFVKILRVSQQDSNLNNNLRHSVLANIREMCRIEPENHVEVDDNFTNSLTEVYFDKFKDSLSNNSQSSIEKSLDKFLIRRMKEAEHNTNNQSCIKPEVVQALLNLSEHSSKLLVLTEDVLYWNVSDKKHLALVKDLWTNSKLTESESICDISIKMKSEIEIILLKVCHSLLNNPILQAEELFITDNVLKDLIIKCSMSPECFQICSSILNYLFVNTNYNLDIQIFISKFIQNVRKNCPNSISLLYPINLNSIIVLLDFDLNVLPKQLRKKYVDNTCLHLKKYEKTITDLVLLLSHFPQWFHIYFDLNL